MRSKFGMTAGLQTEVAEEQGDVGDARHLEEDGADPLGAGRGLDTHQLLGGQDEWHLVGETSEPVDAIDEGVDLRIGANLGELLVTAMHVAAHRFGGDHLLAIEASDDAQRAMGGRVLRSHVEGHALGLEVEIDAVVDGLGGERGDRFRIADGGHSPSPSSSSTPGMGSTSTMPGHGRTRRASSGKSLRSGWPRKSAGRYRLIMFG